ncbi:hypothetical protein HAX54_038742, partial [Datura stramonium]|nr:hypothetical protein [Datura stramonium]
MTFGNSPVGPAKRRSKASFEGSQIGTGDSPPCHGFTPGQFSLLFHIVEALARHQWFADSLCDSPV